MQVNSSVLYFLIRWIKKISQRNASFFIQEGSGKYDGSGECILHKREGAPNTKCTGPAIVTSGVAGNHNSMKVWRLGITIWWISRTPDHYHRSSCGQICRGRYECMSMNSILNNILVSSTPPKAQKGCAQQPPGFAGRVIETDRLKSPEAGTWTETIPDYGLK